MAAQARASGAPVGHENVPRNALHFLILDLKKWPRRATPGQDDLWHQHRGAGAETIAPAPTAKNPRNWGGAPPLTISKCCRHPLSGWAPPRAVRAVLLGEKRDGPSPHTLRRHPLDQIVVIRRDWLVERAPYPNLDLERSRALLRPCAGIDATGRIDQPGVWNNDKRGRCVGLKG